MSLQLATTICPACGDHNPADADSTCTRCGQLRTADATPWPHIRSGQRLPVNHRADLTGFAELGNIRTGATATLVDPPVYRNGPPFCAAIPGHATTGCVMVAGHPGPVHRLAAGQTFRLGIDLTIEHIELLRHLTHNGPATALPVDYCTAEDLVECGLLTRGGIRADGDSRWYYLAGGRYLPPTLGMAYLLLDELVDPEHEVAHLLRAAPGDRTRDNEAPLARAIADVIRQTNRPAEAILAAARRIAARDYLLPEASTHLVINRARHILYNTDPRPHLIVEQVYHPTTLATAIRSLATTLDQVGDLAAEAHAVLGRGAGRFPVTGYSTPSRHVAAEACEAINDNEALPGRRFMVIPDPRVEANN